VSQREEFKRKTRVCAKEGCGELITQPRVWLCDSCEQKRLDKIEELERRKEVRK
jgi:hypothetical protein